MPVVTSRRTAMVGTPNRNPGIPIGRVQLRCPRDLNTKETVDWNLVKKLVAQGKNELPLTLKLLGQLDARIVFPRHWPPVPNASPPRRGATPDRPPAHSRTPPNTESRARVPGRQEIGRPIQVIKPQPLHPKSCYTKRSAATRIPATNAPEIRRVHTNPMPLKLPARSQTQSSLSGSSGRDLREFLSQEVYPTPPRPRTDVERQDPLHPKVRSTVTRVAKPATITSSEAPVTVVTTTLPSLPAPFETTVTAVEAETLVKILSVEPSIDLSKTTIISKETKPPAEDESLESAMKHLHDVLSDDVVDRICGLNHQC